MIAEDLLDADPNSAAHMLRLRQALQLLGVDESTAVIARFPPAEAGSHIEEDVDLSNLVPLKDRWLSAKAMRLPAPPV